MGSRDTDDLEKLGHKLKTVIGDVEKLLVFSNLIHGMKLLWGDGIEMIKSKPLLTKASTLRAQQRLPLQPQQR
jgi:hypothetical protein